MADDGCSRLSGINWRQAFPFTHLFRAFRIAVHPSKLMLGLIALLCLYIGGRILDSAWPARELAVPGEVTDYQRHVAEGGTSAQFKLARQHDREAMEDAYAQRLLDEKITTDRDTALKMAADGKGLDKVRDSLIHARELKVADADKLENEQIATANAIGDRDKRERALRDAREAYNSNRRTAYREAYDEYKAASTIEGVGLFHAFFEYESECVVGVVKGVASGNWLGSSRAGDRGAGVIENVINFFTVGPVWLMRIHPVYFVIFALLFLTVWAIFGGAICRIAAVHVARDEKLSVRTALAFSLGKFLSFVSAPLIPLLIVLIVGLVPLIAGLLGSIPWGVGGFFNIVMGALFVLILAAGFVMTLVLLGTFGGFNLMYPTIAVEGSDSFDAISRSFSYVYARPWRMVFYTLVAIVYGALCYIFVRLFIWLMLTLTHHFIGAGMLANAPSADPLWPMLWRGPSAPPGRLSYEIEMLSLAWHQRIAAFLIAFWVYLVVGMLGGFVISFYFTANTIIYYLMRQEVDATEMDDVYLEQSEEDFTEPGTAPPPPPVIAAPPPAATEATPPPPATPPPAPPPTGDIPPNPAS